MQIKRIPFSIFLMASILICACEDRTAYRAEVKASKERYVHIEKNIESLSEKLSEEHDASLNWEDVTFEYLYEVQEYLESGDKRLVLDYFNDFEIYKSAGKYYLSYPLYAYGRTIYLDLELSAALLNSLKEKKNPNFDYFLIAVIELDSVKTINFEFESELDDYYSRIRIERNKSLKGRGSILDLEYVSERKLDLN